MGSRVRESVVAAVLLSAALGACGGSSSSGSTTPSSVARAPAGDDPSCPVAVTGTSVDVEDTDTGAALVFVTTGDVDELRRRVGAMAQMHNDHHGKMGPLPSGDDRGGGAHAGHDEAAGSAHQGHAGGMIGIHSTARVEDVDGGAKLVFVSGGAEVGKLQDELRMHARHFAAGACHMGTR